VLGKVSEYLEAGVSVVCVLDPEPQTVHIFRAAQQQPVQLLNEDEDFTVPELLGDFRVPVRKFYE
jgi:Uma2 family endonuclease